MTYWATLWYAGAVVLQLGHDGQTLDECKLLTTMMTFSIMLSYQDQAIMKTQSGLKIEKSEFTTSCETEILAE